MKKYNAFAQNISYMLIIMIFIQDQYNYIGVIYYWNPSHEGSKKNPT